MPHAADRGTAILPPRSPLRRSWPPIATLLVFVALAVAAPSPAVAHAELVSSSPAANSTLLEAPGEVSLTFTEAVDPATARVRLLDVQGAEIGGVAPPSVDGALVRATLPVLRAGVYTVDYRVTSAVDGHITSGIFAFLVDPTGTQPAPGASTVSESPSSTPEATASRWLALAAALALAGTLGFWLVSARPALAAAGLPRSTPWILFAALGALATAGLVAYLFLAARPLLEAGGSGPWFPLDPAAPFGATQFAMSMRVATLGMLSAAVLASAGAALSRHDGPWIGLALAASLVGLAGMSLAGHAAASGGVLFGAFDFLHLVSVAAWLGALVGVAIIAVRARSATGAALRRHSRVALVAAPLVALSGIANSPLVLGSEARDLVASDYGNLLLGKILLFGVAVGLGAANFFLVRRNALRIALPVVAVELVIGALAVAAAAGLVTGQPAGNRPGTLVATPIGVVHLYGTAGQSAVHAAVNLPAPGEQRYQVSVADIATGAYRDDVQRVFLVFTPPEDSDLAAERVQLAPDQEAGLWGATGAYTPVVGAWELEVVVRRAGQRDEETRFPLEVVLPVPPQRVPPADTGIGVPLPLAVLWTVLPTGWLAWSLPLALLLGAAALFVAGRGSAAGRRPALARATIVALAVVAGVGGGSRALVGAANAPPTSAAARTNPVASSSASISRGERLYLANCSSCHATDGSGTGPAAEELPPLAHLRDRVPELSDGAIEYRIAVGATGTRMPGFAGTLSEDERWDLVNYLRTTWSR